MTYWFIDDLLIFLLCVLFAGILIPQILLIAFRKSLFDMPDERKIHRGIVPRLGGIAFTPVVCFSMSLLLGVSLLIGDLTMSQMMDSETLPLAMGFCALFLIYIVGVGDDLIGIRYKAKFVAQIAAAALIISGGTYIHGFHGLLWLEGIPSWVGWILTVGFVVFVCNAINLIDGIDGLASGLAATAFIIYGVAFNILGQHIYGLISFASLGVLIPFYYYNVFGDPNKQKKIFMGDAGSLTIGLMLAFLSLRLYISANARPDLLDCNPTALALAPLIVPCFDVIRVFIGRIRRGKDPFMPDRTHIHHKLLALGMPSRIAMVTIVSVALVFSAANVILSAYININLLIALDILVWGGGNRIITLVNRKRKAQG